MPISKVDKLQILILDVYLLWSEFQVKKRRILSDYIKISNQNFWQDSVKNSGWNWFNLITLNKPYLGKASIFSTIPLHRSSRRISWAIDIIYRPAVATPWVHCIFIGYVSIQHTDLLSIINNRNTFSKIQTFFKRWINLKRYFQYLAIFIKTPKLASNNFFVNVR